MIEQKIESAILAKINALNLDGVKVVTSWTATEEGEVKGGVYEPVEAVLTLRVRPRSYSTFTIREADVAVELEYSSLVENDPNGAKRLAAVDSVSAILFSWQNSITNVVNDLSVADEFVPTGFRLDGGDCGMNADQTEWVWSQSATIQGIIINN